MIFSKKNKKLKKEIEEITAAYENAVDNYQKVLKENHKLQRQVIDLKEKIQKNKHKNTQNDN